jgi:hypothetical protein
MFLPTNDQYTYNTFLTTKSQRQELASRRPSAVERTNAAGRRPERAAPIDRPSYVATSTACQLACAACLQVARRIQGWGRCQVSVAGEASRAPAGRQSAQGTRVGPTQHNDTLCSAYIAMHERNGNNGSRRGEASKTPHHLIAAIDQLLLLASFYWAV